MKIETKINILFIIVFSIGIIVSGIVSSKLLQENAQQQVTAKAQILMQVMNSVRNYTNNRIYPLLEPRLQTEPTFIAEIVPAFSAIQVFEDMRKNPDYKNFFYKEATLNPTNLRDKADSFETELVNKFRKNKNIKQISGYRQFPEGENFFIAYPLTVNQQSCLQCHSTPEAAPKSQIASYGSFNGFGWKLNEIITAQVIYIPAAQVMSSAQRSAYVLIGALMIILSTILFIINFLLRKTIIQRIKKMANVAERVSTGETNSDFEKQSNDEIGALAAAFNRMKKSLEIALKMLEQQTY
jgi:HAMP domain-containing protein/nitrate reductase cytochrome c-type subunit